MEPTSDPRAHAVLGVTLGSTPAVLISLIEQGEGASGERVPFRLIAIDSLKYDQLIERIGESGYSRARAKKLLPKENYFHLGTPFARDFDFDDPRHSDWDRIIYEPSLRRLAARPEEPGCAGTAALGHARLLANARKISSFVREHVQALTRAKAGALHLEPGIIVRLYNTLRGGTSGATLTLGALLREELPVPPKEFVLVAAMPEIWGEDERARAQAYAALTEWANAHREGASVPLLDGEELDPPFDRVVTAFASNGRHTQTPSDFLHGQAEIFHLLTRADSQRVFVTRHVDSIDKRPYDHWGNTMHVRKEASLTIRNVQEAAPDYLAASRVQQAFEARHRRFTEILGDEADLTATERDQVSTVVDELVEDLGLTSDGLARRVDPEKTGSALRSQFEKWRSDMQRLDAASIKKETGKVQKRVREIIEQAEREWQDRAEQCARELPGEIVEYVRKRLADTPHLILHALGRVVERLRRLVEDVRPEAEKQGNLREKKGRQASEAISAVRDAGTLLGFRGDEIARNAAMKALPKAFGAARARVQQELLEYVLQVVEDGLPQPHDEPISGLLERIRARRHEEEARLRTKWTERSSRLRERLDDLGDQLDQTAHAFSVSLAHEEGRAALDAQLDEVQSRGPDGDPERVVEYLKGETSLDDAVEALKAHFSLYTESQRSLESVFRELSENGRRHVLGRLKTVNEPYTPTDKVVESDHGLSDRQDNVKVYQVPGGSEGVIGEMLVEEGICEASRIIESNDGQIHALYVRDGLPYYALSQLDKYERAYRRYTARPDTVPVHTHEGPHELIEEPSEDVEARVERLLLAARAVWGDEVVARLPDGRARLTYEVETSRGFSEESVEERSDWDDLVNWLARRVDVFRRLSSRLDNFRKGRPSEYRSRLTEAYHEAGSSDGRTLRVALHEAGFDVSDLSGGQHPPSGDGMPA
jgi:hypothetical protein